MTNWPMKKILEVCDFERGTEPGSHTYNRDGVGTPFIRVGNIAAQIQKQIYTTSENLKLCKKDDILIALDGSPGIVTRGIEGAYSSGIRKVILKDPKNIFYYFIYYILQAKFLQNIIKEYSTGVTIKHASKSLEHIKIPLPSFPAQQKIVYVLDGIQAAVGVQEKIIKRTKELKKSLMHKLFREGTRGEKLKKTETPKQSKLVTGQAGEIPESWDIIQFKKTLDSEVNYEVGELKQKDYQETGKYFIVDQGEELIAGYSDNKNLIYQGPLPVVIFGDHTRVVKLIDFPFIIGGSGVKILIPTKEFNIDYFYYLISGLNIESRGYNRHFGILKEKTIPKPSFSEQLKIARILQAIDRKIEIEQKKKAFYEELFRTTLNKLMKNKIKLDNLRI
jgi:type I restriction enzyme, S subunit